MTTYIICGPTASGKSSLSLDLAHYKKGNIINADSMQMYKDLPILSAQPSNDNHKEIPHFLYGSLGITETHSVGKWLEKIRYLLPKHPNHPSLFVGGTGLYIKSLLEGLSPIPDVPESLRSELSSLLLSSSKEHVFDLLQKEDPLSAQKIGPHNSQRILRALEVIRYTKKSLVDWQKEPREKIAKFPLPIKIILIDPDREALYESINHRVSSMLESGAIEEVTALKERGITPSHTSIKTIGYEEIFAYLDHALSRKEMIEQIQQKTRNYAKRQITWFRHQLSPDLIWPKVYSHPQWTDFLSEMKW